jgi:TatD DNase family protein
MLFDSHCHLQDKRLSSRLNSIIERALSAGVGEMMCCGVQPGDWEEVANLGKRFDSVHVSFGVHPWFVEKAEESWRSMLVNYLESHPGGVGEIGLDFVRNDILREVQEHFFREQIRIANRLNRPVSIHCRKAFQRVKEIIVQEGLECGGVMHSYSGAAEMVSQFENMGLYISFSGAITRSRNKKGHKALLAVSSKRLLLETDSPDLAPIDSREELNEPANIVSVARSAAEILDVGFEQICDLTYSNAGRLFSIKHAK